MSVGWPNVALNEVLRKSEAWVNLEPTVEYREVTVRLWGKGVVERRVATGAEIAADRRIAVKPNQFILSRIDARHGAFGLVPSELDGAVVSTDFPVFSLNENRLLSGFLNWMSKTSVFIDLCKAASEGTTNRVRLKEDRFLAMTIPLPPLAEQRRIVARIDALAARIEEAWGRRRQAAAEVEALTNSAARSRLSLTNVPITRLGDWLDPDRDGIQTGPFGAQLSSADFVDEGVPILTIGNVQYHGLHLQDLKHVSHEKARELQRFALSEGDILFARMGTVGRCCVAPSNANGWLINYHIIRVALDKEKADPRYVHWTIRASADVQEYLGGTIRGATRQGVNSGIVAGLPCRIPPLPEQRRIVAYLDDLQARVDAVKRLQAETQAELDALLPAVLDKAFKGEL